MVWCGRMCVVVCVWYGVGVCVSLCWVLLTQTAVYRRGKLGRSDDEQKHWLQYAVPKYSVSLYIIIMMCGPSEISFSHTQVKFMEDVRLFLRVLVMLLPLPIFWALFDQQVKYCIVWLILKNRFFCLNQNSYC